MGRKSILYQAGINHCYDELFIHYCLVTAIPKRALVPQGSQSTLLFQLSSIDVSVPSLNPHALTPGESIAGKILCDATYRDVFFILDGPSFRRKPKKSSRILHTLWRTLTWNPRVSTRAIHFRPRVKKFNLGREFEKTKPRKSRNEPLEPTRRFSANGHTSRPCSKEDSQRVAQA